MNTLIVYGDTSIIESIEVDHFDSEHRFTSDEGLNFAFGMVSFDEDYSVDPDYGEIVARYEKWGSQVSTLYNEKIPVKKCTNEELGVSAEDRSGSRFYPINKSQ